MKHKFGILTLAILILAGCAEISTLIPSSDKTPQTKQGMLNSCMLTEADNRLKSGNLFTYGIPSAAREIAMTCIRKLSLESEGLEGQAVLGATNILNSMK